MQANRGPWEAQRHNGPALRSFVKDEVAGGMIDYLRTREPEKYADDIKAFEKRWDPNKKGSVLTY